MAQPSKLDPTQIVEVEVLDTGAVYRNAKVSGLFGARTPDRDKPAMKSKKFVAFLITQSMFFVLLMVMLIRQDVSNLATNAAFLSLVFCQAFIGSAFIGGQALVDRFVSAAPFNRSRDEDEEGKGA